MASRPRTQYILVGTTSLDTTVEERRFSAALNLPTLNGLYARCRLSADKTDFRRPPVSVILRKAMLKNFLRALGRIALLALLLAVASILYSTWRGYIRWYFRVDGQVLVNGQETTGYLHANTEKSILLLTRTDDSRPETYLVTLGPTKTAFDCRQWHPLRFLPFPAGHENPPCSAFTIDPLKVHDPPTTATVNSGRNFVEFSTSSGKKVRGQW